MYRTLVIMELDVQFGFLCWRETFKMHKLLHIVEIWAGIVNVHVHSLIWYCDSECVYFWVCMFHFENVRSYSPNHEANLESGRSPARQRWVLIPTVVWFNKLVAFLDWWCVCFTLLELMNFVAVGLNMDINFGCHNE